MVDIDPQRHGIFPNFNSSTHAKFNIEPEIDGWKRNFLLGWLIFKGYVSFRKGKIFSLFNVLDPKN